MSEFFDTTAGGNDSWETAQGDVPEVAFDQKPEGIADTPTASDTEWLITAPEAAGGGADETPDLYGQALTSMLHSSAGFTDRPTAVTEVNERASSATGDYGDAGNALAVDDRSHVYPDAPRLSAADLWERKYAWGQQAVNSCVTAVGLIEPTEAEIAAINNWNPRDNPFGYIKESSSEWPDTAQARASFDSLVRTDMERNGLEGDLLFATKAGLFEPRHSEPLHSDNFGSASVRWTVAMGLGSTIGANGMVSRSDTNIHSGNLLEHVEVGPDKQLEPVTFREGEVVRFMNDGDIHAGPEGRGMRLLLVATLFLPGELRR